MNRRIASAAILATLLLAVGACSSTNNASTGNTQAPTTAAGNTSTTKGETSDTKTTDTKSTGTTRGNTGTTRSSTGTTGKGGGGFDLTADQKECIGKAAQAAAASDPEVADIVSSMGSGSGKTLTAPQAALVGGLIVGCVPKTDLAAALTQGLKNSPEGKGINSEGFDCIEKQILALDSDDLALFIAVLAVAGESGDKSIAAPAISKLNQACNTNIPA